MSIFKKLEEIRKRPTYERKKILITLTTIIMVIVLAIWLSALKYQSNSKNEENKTENPWEVLKKAFSFPK